MNQYRVEFFDRNLNYVHHDNINEPEISNDYLAPETSEIVIAYTDKIPQEGFIRIIGDYSFFGVIDSASHTPYETTVLFRPIICMFDKSIVFDTAWQTDGSVLEEKIKNRIDAWFGADVSDDLAKLPLEVETTSSTTDWNFGIEPSSEDNSKAVINLMSDIIIPALQKHGIVVNAEPDFNSKTIKITVGTVEGSINISADNIYVTCIEYVKNKFNADINKLIVYNKNFDDETQITYYLHPDKTYDTNDENRMEPVKHDVVSVSETSGTAFEDAAKAEADRVFSGIEYQNYCELDVSRNDLLINPLSMRIGQGATIYRNTEVLESILTGIIFGKIVTLMFGAVRLDLTKQE